MNNRLILIMLFCFSGTTALSQELNLFLQEIKEERFNGKHIAADPTPSAKLCLLPQSTALRWAITIL